MPQSMVTLPERNEMLSRLLKIDPCDYLTTHFYQRLLESAGQPKVKDGCVMMFIMARRNYASRLPQTLLRKLDVRMADFVDALVRDPIMAYNVKQELKIPQPQRPPLHHYEQRRGQRAFA